MREDQDLFKITMANRDREIALLWTRSNAMWLIVAVCFAAYGVVREDILSSIAVAIVGFMSSASWACLLAGSKWWQECWEQKVQQVAPEKYKQFLTKSEVVTGEVWLFKLTRYSPAKIMILLACFLIILWASIGSFDIVRFYAKTRTGFREFHDLVLPWIPVYLLGLVVIFSALLLFSTKGRDKGPPILTDLW